MIRLLSAYRKRRGWRRIAARAQSSGDWESAIEAWRRVVAKRPVDYAAIVQLGHVLKEHGDVAAAVETYRRAASLAPHDTDSRRHLAASLNRMGDPAAAAAVYRELLAIDPLDLEAVQVLADMGLRRSLPDNVNAASLIERQRQRLDDLVAEAARLENWLRAVAVPENRYRDYRQRYPLSSAPFDRKESLTAIVLADGAPPSGIAATLDGLSRSTADIDCAIVVGGIEGNDHPVSTKSFESMACEWCSDLSVATPREPDHAILVVAAGTIVEPEGAGWLILGRTVTEATLLYGDHDHIELDWQSIQGHRSRPRLFSAHDRVELGGSASLPRVVLTTYGELSAAWAATPGHEVDDLLRAMLLRTDRGLHVPRCVSSVVAMAPARRLEDTEGPQAPADPPYLASTGISIIIPTRNREDLLERCVATLMEKAAWRDRIRIIILDNGSSSAKALDLLERLRQEGHLVHRVDAPFNWSRLNNIGAALTADPVVVFSNNDVEMVTDAWDNVLLASLRASKGGIVGARLLYPDGRYQHAGVLMGIDRRHPLVHEGVLRPGCDEGPGHRWRTRRQASAVTGAFMAADRSVFDTVGGFDESLAVGYGDIDFCLRSREAGWMVVYEPELCLIHQESASRGKNVAGEQLAWDAAELSLFAWRWRGELNMDPGYNPQWAQNGVAFDGFREPDRSQIDAWMRRQTRSWTAWRASRSDGYSGDATSSAID